MPARETDGGGDMFGGEGVGVVRKWDGGAGGERCVVWR